MLTKLNNYVRERGLKAIGPVSGIYYNTPNEVSSVQDIEWEVFCAVESNTPEAVADKYGFGVRTMRGTKVASIVHQGSYRKADTSYECLHGWIQCHGLKVCGPSEEVYLTDITDPAVEQRIEIRLPVSVG
jgi:effector-binding domain-containing protein